jgi:hypothetical protein
MKRLDSCMRMDDRHSSLTISPSDRPGFEGTDQGSYDWGSNMAAKILLSERVTATVISLVVPRTKRLPYPPSGIAMLCIEKWAIPDASGGNLFILQPALETCTEPPTSNVE